MDEPNLHERFVLHEDVVYKFNITYTDYIYDAMLQAGSLKSNIRDWSDVRKINRESGKQNWGCSHKFPYIMIKH